MSKSNKDRKDYQAPSKKKKGSLKPVKKDKYRNNYGYEE